ncbi:MAG: hypothetical protein U9N77_16720, partial [Thermodesulfobacteriota bacterium]|nr:hypothetical protein [Thermodesulfobacteriota bacterium]
MTSFSGLFGADIILTVKAAGYWYTSGGVKGSFGYYPHLKDDHGLPFFPDTQVRGNLKTAVQWYCNLIGTPFPKNLFGEEGVPSASLLKVGDLVLTPNSR